MNRSDMIAEVSIVLNDPVNTRWSVPFHEASLQGALREIAKLKPAAFTVTESIKLVSGNRQKLPADGEMLVEIHRNMGGDGETPGRAVNQVSYTLLRTLTPGWGDHQTDDEIDDYAFDIRDPRSFLVFPSVAPEADVHVEVSFVKTPPSDTEDIPVSDLELEAVRDWVLYRAYQLDTGAGSMQKAQKHLQAFMLAVTGSAQSIAMASPDPSGDE